MKLIDGKQIANSIKQDLRSRVTKLDPKPGLAAILVGHDPASEIYVGLKKKACRFTGMDFHEYLIDEESSEKELLECIEFLNADPSTNGILVQLPLPEKFNEKKIISAIDPRKDVDGFHESNLESLKKNQPQIISGLALGIMRLIEEAENNLENKKAVIICNSKEFSQPLVYLLNKKNIQGRTIAPTHRQLPEICSRADILVVAVGIPRFINREHVKPGAIVIDVGTNKMNDGQLLGDVDIEDLRDVEGYITPVPGGVGPMTVAMLLKNTLKLYNQQFAE